MHDVIELSASFEDGRLTIERRDGKPISVISHEEINSGCVEILELGSRGNAVHALQALLNCHGQHLELDGIFGQLTQTALLIFQDQHKLSPTGECSSEEWKFLIGR